MEELTHLNLKGEAHMVDVSPKAETVRDAEARAVVRMKPETLQLVSSQQLKKGDVFAVARIAGIMAAKQTPALIPLCHTLLLDQVEVEIFPISHDSVEIKSRVRCTGRTGVEMEALLAASVAALAIYDMCKAVDRGIVIENICLEKKSGGKSGTFIRPKMEDYPA